MFRLVDSLHLLTSQFELVYKLLSKIGKLTRIDYAEQTLIYTSIFLDVCLPTTLYIEGRLDENTFAEANFSHCFASNPFCISAGLLRRASRTKFGRKKPLYFSFVGAKNIFCICMTQVQERLTCTRCARGKTKQNKKMAYCKKCTASLTARRRSTASLLSP